jgi:uncharacterized protein with HEPN domain
MLEHAREARLLLADNSKVELEENRLLQLALTRLLEVVGEAANRVPYEDRARHPGIPWAQIIGMRNRLIHGYDVVDFDVLWQTVVEDLPPLIKDLDSILRPP